MEWVVALRKGLMVFLWSILWWLIGAVIAIIISGGAMLSIISTTQMAPLTTTEAISQSLGSVLLTTTGLLIGGLVSSIGVYATVIKHSVEAAIEEFREESKHR